jgi:hypothetical protein
MNKLFNGQKHKPKVTQNCPLDFPKFTPSPNLGASPPFLSSLPGVEHGNSKEANDKATRRAMQKEGHNKTTHPSWSK